VKKQHPEVVPVVINIANTQPAPAPEVAEVAEVTEVFAECEATIMTKESERFKDIAHAMSIAITGKDKQECIFAVVFDEFYDKDCFNIIDFIERLGKNARFAVMREQFTVEDYNDLWFVYLEMTGNVEDVENDPEDDSDDEDETYPIIEPQPLEEEQEEVILWIGLNNMNAIRTALIEALRIIDSVKPTLKPEPETVEPEPETVEPEPETVEPEPETVEPEPETVEQEPETVEQEPEPETVEQEPEPETVEQEPEPETVEPEPETVEQEPEPETVEPEPETVEPEPETPEAEASTSTMTPIQRLAKAEETLNAHPYTMKRKEVVYRCPCCYKEYKAPHQLIKHLQAKHPSLNNNRTCIRFLEAYESLQHAKQYKPPKQPKAETTPKGKAKPKDHVFAPVRLVDVYDVDESYLVECCKVFKDNQFEGYRNAFKYLYDVSKCNITQKTPTSRIKNLLDDALTETINDCASAWMDVKLLEEFDDLQECFNDEWEYLEILEEIQEGESDDVLRRFLLGCLGVEYAPYIVVGDK
jgi:hypothetical protein